MEIVCKKKDLDKKTLRVYKIESEREINAKVAKQVRQLMHNNKTKLSFLAEHMGTTKAGLSYKLNNKRKFTVLDLKLISDFYGAKIVIA